MRRGGLGGAFSIELGVELVVLKSCCRSLSCWHGGVLLVALFSLFVFKTGVLLSAGGLVDLEALDETGVIA